MCVFVCVCVCVCVCACVRACVYEREREICVCSGVWPIGSSCHVYANVANVRCKQDTHDAQTRLVKISFMDCACAGFVLSFVSGCAHGNSWFIRRILEWQKFFITGLLILKSQIKIDPSQSWINLKLEANSAYAILIFQNIIGRC